MKKQKNMAFTLIELLVVITIIGILATGAVAIFTAQIQKARDSNRVSDIKILQSAAEQVYQDETEYPRSTNFSTLMSPYLDRFPEDPKSGNSCSGSGTNTTACDYIYVTGQSTFGIDYGMYELSTGFENSSNVKNKANNNFDNGNDNDRFETGLDNSTADTSNNGAINSTFGGCTDKTNGNTPSVGTEAIVIKKDC